MGDNDKPSLRRRPTTTHLLVAVVSRPPHEIAAELEIQFVAVLAALRRCCAHYPAASENIVRSQIMVEESAYRYIRNATPLLPFQQGIGVGTC